MAQNPFDKDLSVSGELTETGIKGSTNSRAVNALDWLCGSWFDWLGVGREGKNAMRRAKDANDRAFIEMQTDLIKAVSVAAQEKITKDPEFAARAIENLVEGSLRKQANKEAVGSATEEQLKLSPPRDPDAFDGPEKLSGQFSARFEKYAEEADTDALREKWGRVLAEEIKKPGTFSSKTMRIVDELDGSLARSFEEFCACRMGRLIPRALSGTLEFNLNHRLVEAGLIVDPGIAGQSLKGIPLKASNLDLWIYVFENTLIGIPTNTTVGGGTAIPECEPFRVNEAGKPPFIPVYVLTEVGQAIASILPEPPEEAVERFVVKAREQTPSIKLIQYLREGAKLSLVRSY